MTKHIRKEVVLATLEKCRKYNSDFLLCATDTECGVYYANYSIQTVKEKYEELQKDIEKFYAEDNKEVILGCMSVDVYKKENKIEKDLAKNNIERFCDYCTDTEYLFALSDADISINEDVIQLDTPYGRKENIKIICCPVCGREL